jgi:hypothetical protein
VIPLNNKGNFCSNCDVGVCFDQECGDLFAADDKTALAHCVSVDLKMNAGIAAVFKQKFAHIEQLMKLKPQVGKCYYLDDNLRKIFYLVTKLKYYDKPRYNDLKTCLQNLKECCDQLNVKKLTIPKFECGLDKLDLQKVSTLIDKTFKNARTKLTVYFRHTVSDLLIQNIVHSIHMINKIEQRNIGFY